MSANIAPPAEPRPPRLTFGVEMEFLVPWLLEGGDDALEHIKGLPPVIRIKEVPKDGNVERVIHGMIKALFEKHNLPTNIKSHTYMYKTDFIKSILGNYNHWGVTDDVTVNEPFEAKTFDWIEKFRWVGVEVQSPVEPDIPGAFEVLNYARQLLTSSYRCRVNHSCGLHVHVGNGGEYFPLDSMRRIASLVFATEHLLTTLNHPWRVANYNCRTMRDRSNLSNLLAGQAMSPGPMHEADPARDCIRYLATEVRHGEEPISWREEHRANKYVDDFEEHRKKSGFEPFQPKPDTKEEEAPKEEIGANEKTAGEKEEEKKVIKASEDPFSQPIEPNKPVRTRNIPRIVRPRYTNEQLEDMTEKSRDFGCAGLYFEGPRSQRAPDPGVFAGVQQIYQSASSCEIAHLMYPRGASMVNFRHYACDSFLRHYQGRTIEFRGAEGSLSSWVVTWAKICVGLVKFAIRSPYHEFARVLENCDASTDEDGAYDCIDLLDDLGLYAEAEAAEKRIAAKKVEWGLEYVEKKAA
ncbi:hypothetical protein F5Y00DRAFT_267427 [Daldinia vernicosa]|uniref:uncharacterized protein n=1 Tax=Daldinia vernicosa TaxID=114800 RepID=UPI0020072D87|nr:uncharacterized protein F5Y00DRAFT_267427 [Daldinia vernicosa]KAI0854174.1 hypothetical protein F5Y00DRAFT_267427 [Daldinia vernicosa]